MSFGNGPAKLMDCTALKVLGLQKKTATTLTWYSKAGGCSADSIVAVCLDIPADGDYLDVSDGYYYDGAVGTEDACGDAVGGSWEYIGE